MKWSEWRRRISGRWPVNCSYFCITSHMWWPDGRRKRAKGAYHKLKRPQIGYSHKFLCLNIFPRFWNRLISSWCNVFFWLRVKLFHYMYIESQEKHGKQQNTSCMKLPNSTYSNTLLVGQVLNMKHDHIEYTSNSKQWWILDSTLVFLWVSHLKVLIRLT